MGASLPSYIWLPPSDYKKNEYRGRIPRDNRSRVRYLRRTTQAFAQIYEKGSFQLTLLLSYLISRQYVQISRKEKQNLNRCQQPVQKSKEQKAKVLQEVVSELDKVIETEGLNPKKFFEIPPLESKATSNLHTRSEVIEESSKAKRKSPVLKHKSPGQSPIKRWVTTKKDSTKALQEYKNLVLIKVNEELSSLHNQGWKQRNDLSILFPDDDGIGACQPNIVYNQCLIVLGIFNIVEYCILCILKLVLEESFQ
eukprot:TRINITY_DN122907_c0_g1_i1.p2 TRINITY_DN122907_c0_g1~~TRINITY_DN122907_c0_g1_i1.p2  ORF type:complete len:253 (-),score=-6.56 TRINITY_DN122907_c0_g1_i1:347-1105(-)